ncbi:homocysteine S-methyltransferase [Jeotgalibacillus haloalkalitolerans]|uniref:Homocysteine S-methyltransferase n=1 Tax=Jeotgalibacillus haloalkalitolerans TaxID=3104292 RepID=A0ABU5KHI0_9BACL|nr:homocysteine S-methyltransferase [Jeotgalibacillus sp. HH7-29]MDZ5710657.1 homocysteine S-methyltransferase [Jeotgalibacillus sp. HH7-29]
MNPIENILNDYPIIILDGALATELEGYGCDLNDQLWSAKILLENPELIKKVHLDYFEAGADCAITASYQATIEGYQQRGLSEKEAVSLITKSVQLAAEARDEFWAGQPGRPKPLVAASVGPYGAFLSDGSEYRGDYAAGFDELVAFHKGRIKVLVEAGTDLLACETIPCLEEAKAIVEVLSEFPEVTAWISFSAKDLIHNSNGEKIADCAEWLNEQEQVAAVGINCSAPETIESLINEVKSRTAKPVIVYPNSGEKYNAVTKVWGGESSSDQFAEDAKKWHKAGARIIGGCCRTTPEDIRAIAAWARE